jgi:hypothetical protein
MRRDRSDPEKKPPWPLCLHSHSRGRSSRPVHVGIRVSRVLPSVARRRGAWLVIAVTRTERRAGAQVEGSRHHRVSPIAEIVRLANDRKGPGAARALETSAHLETARGVTGPGSRTRTRSRCRGCRSRRAQRRSRRPTAKVRRGVPRVFGQARPSLSSSRSCLRARRGVAPIVADQCLGRMVRGCMLRRRRGACAAWRHRPW